VRTEQEGVGQGRGRDTVNASGRVDMCDEGEG
jgi:hypothetical protein